MKTEKITIANLKCAGCENTIKKRVSEIEGVKNVHISHEEDLVTVDMEDTVERSKITQLLHKLGYPEATEENGLLLQLKSYASCMVGRLSKPQA
ncbi:MAG: heavy-metal-associated domain-containing protein [Crocinitomicaceae bacterium]|nr:heavy-metal-associated domain-containing protein [Crocinitomicaceae bacterium]